VIPRGFETLARRLGIRGGLVAVMLVGAVIAAAIVVIGRADGSAERRASGSTSSPSLVLSSSRPPEGSVLVPDVVGLSEGEAVKALGASGLVGNVRYAYDAPRTGAVLGSDPDAGRELPANSVVVLSIALGPRLPIPRPGHEQDLQPFNSLVEQHADAFVGLYRDEAGIPHAVFGPGADPATWREPLAVAAEGLPYRTDTCSRTRESLRAMQDEIATKGWSENKRLAFGVWVHPETCTVRIESDLLTAADIRALADRYGTAISIDTSEGAHPVLLSLED
jgi:hypothetical protein